MSVSARAAIEQPKGMSASCAGVRCCFVSFLASLSFAREEAGEVACLGQCLKVHEH